jgi:NAD(P)-dependent dehydrogenase (short-subunit alcohol dehydrogenase family)
MAELGRAFAEREAEHGDGLGAARRCAERLRVRVHDAVEAFEEAARAAGGPPLGIHVSELRLDDKHVRSVQFELRRGRHVAIVTVKSRGDVTLVGPFHAGKKEGPCASFPMRPEADAELCRALGDFLERFVEEATTP